MKSITFLNTDSKVESSQIEDFEKEIKKPIPKGFTEFLLSNNGGRTNEVVFTETNGNHQIINDFLPLTENRNGSIRSLLPLVNDERALIEWLPFGYDPGGWVFCICLKEECYGKIHLFRMDKIYEENFDYVCESFEDFINGLRTEEEAFT
jgi:SMI1-KNR4 cell-wall